MGYLSSFLNHYLLDSNINIFIVINLKVLIINTHIQIQNQILTLRKPPQLPNTHTNINVKFFTINLHNFKIIHPKPSLHHTQRQTRCNIDPTESLN